MREHKRCSQLTSASVPNAADGAIPTARLATVSFCLAGLQAMLQQRCIRTRIMSLDRKHRRLRLATGTLQCLSRQQRRHHPTWQPWFEPTVGTGALEGG